METVPAARRRRNPQPGNGVLLTQLVCTTKRLPRKGLPPGNGVSLTQLVCTTKRVQENGLPPGKGECAAAPRVHRWPLPKKNEKMLDIPIAEV